MGNSLVKKQSMGMLLLKSRTAIALVLLLIFFSFAAPNFTSWSSIVLMVKHASIYGLLAVGMTMVLLTGGIDLSVGSMVGLSGMIAGGLINQGLVLNSLGMTVYFSIPMIILIVTVMCVLIGLVNAVLISYLKVPPFIATLGTQQICRGFAMLRNGGATFPNLIGKEELGNQGFDWLGSKTVPAIDMPVSIFIFFGIAIIAWYIIKKTSLGMRIYAVGGNEKAARLSGVRTDRIKLFVYMFGGLCCALCGLIVTSQLRAAHPATGDGYEMNAISSAVLGGTSLSGGIGSIGGTIIGMMVITVLNDGMVMMGVSQFWQMVIKGTVVVLAVIIDQMQGEMQKKIALQQRNAA